MAYTIEVKGNPGIEVSTSVESFWLYCEFAVDQANCQLTVQNGYFAFLDTRKGMPSQKPMGWGTVDLSVKGPAGVGGFELIDLTPLRHAGWQIPSESAQLHFSKFKNTAPSRWLDASGWAGVNPLDAIVAGLNDTEDKNFHKIELGGDGERRASLLLAETTAGGTDQFAACVPMSPKPLIQTILKNASHGADARHMPTLKTKTSYNLDSSGHGWDHFTGTKSAIPGGVVGYALIAQGAFKSVMTGELDDWFMAAADGWTPERIFRKLKGTVQLSPPVPRGLHNLLNVDISTIVQPGQSSPTEVVFLKGLNSSQSVFP